MIVTKTKQKIPLTVTTNIFKDKKNLFSLKSLNNFTKLINSYNPARFILANCYYFCKFISNFFC